MSNRLADVHIAQARAADVLALAAAVTSLRRVGRDEYAGPCPRCGGADRFHATAAWFFCRQCHPGRGDAIEFLRWQQPGLTFPQAVAQLTGHLPPHPSPAVTPPRPHAMPPRATPQSANWRRRARAIAQAAHAHLWHSAQAQTYLRRRGLEPQTWQAYGLGFRPDVPVPGTRGQQIAPALVIPWRTPRGIHALRYRFLEPQIQESQRGRKLTAEPGSRFAGRLYGGQTLPRWVTLPAPPGNVGAQQYCTLLVVEGELNAMSCWQAAGATHLHVLSLGSEGQTIPPAAVPWMGRYGQVLMWADRAEIAQRLARTVPDAVGIQSPGGRDANDLLQAGLLGGFLAALRAAHVPDDRAREGLLWDLCDAARLPAGIDEGTAHILQRLAHQLGKRISLHEQEPGRWVLV